ncbi:hypothetical protein GWK47_031341 [Chionoecetes opilio]|uniref:Uncharacterized protein n=1 Tax=Chionoecetes opilio TaxID=41210 RepID=A0A8J4YV55_CHIOP|nr:hypothetical protein GWK47_031341 [Chionoecetes opilio]
MSCATFARLAAHARIHTPILISRVVSSCPCPSHVLTFHIRALVAPIVKDKLMRSATHGGVRVKPDWSLLAVTATGDQSQPGPSGNSDQPTTDQWHWSVVGWSPEAVCLVHLNNMLRFASPYKRGLDDFGWEQFLALGSLGKS